MQASEFQVRGVDDIRLAAHATASLPAWLWSVDGARILWANPVGAALFNARNATALADKTFGPADPHRRQIAQLAAQLLPHGATRLQRLRGFGAAFGRLVTCACSKLDFADGATGILVVAAEPVGRAMPLVERLQRLVEGMETPVAAFGRDGLFLGASEPARALRGFRNLSDAGLDAARDGALRDGRVETPIGIGHVVLQRVGSGPDIGLVALLTPGTVLAPETVPAAPEPPHEPEPTMPTVEAEASEPQTPTEAADDSGDLLVEPLPDAPGEQPAPPEPAMHPLATDHDAPENHAAALLPHETLTDPIAEDLLVEAAAQSAPDPSVDHHESEPEEGAAEPLPPRRNPLRFVWQMEADGRFLLRSDDFIRLIGPQTAASFGRPWTDIAADLSLDPDGRVASAVASRTTWSGIALDWPVDPPGERLRVELSGLPVFAAGNAFAGYRGFGVCRDLDALTDLAELRGAERSNGATPRSLSAHSPHPPDETPRPVPVDGSDAEPNSSHPEPDTAVDIPQNVVPIRPTADQKSPALTPVESSAFNELARQLSARLENDNMIAAEPAAIASGETVAPQDNAQPDWLTKPPAPPSGLSGRDRVLLDLMPVGVLIYRLDRLLYANAAFLARMRYPGLQALEDAGGLDALYVEPGVSHTSSTSDTGTPVTIVATQTADAPTAAHLFTIAWDGEAALALICANAEPEPVTAVEPVVAMPAVIAPGLADAEDLGAILDTAAEGIVMFDAAGTISACNRSAEALFGVDDRHLTQQKLHDLFAPESQRVVQDYLDSIASAEASGLLDHGREVLGSVRSGGLLPLALTMGRTRPDGPNFFAVFRDLTPLKKSESDLAAARGQAERASNAKAEVLARISHEVRTPLNAIIGFSDVMIEQRFGALGNERYVEYMKDIRGCGERVIAIINDLTDLARIETGRIDLAFANQDLNELVEQCVAVMQPQANRERIIIRSSLAHLLPPVIADARALRQITLNLIGSSIRLANAGGQVIVSTALSDLGDVVLRVRDTGHGLNDNELAAALQPFRTPADRGTEHAGVNLSLTRALVEANRAQFNIKTAAQSGTLIEVVFSHAAAKV